MATRSEILHRIAQPLETRYGEREAMQIARLLVEELSGVSRLALLTDPAAELEIPGLDAQIEELATGRPVQYVVGSTEFCGQRLLVREGVLIPRPETEELVLQVAHENPAAQRILDVGTGSGCIAIALKQLLPQAELFAADISEQALSLAAENARNAHTPITFRKADALTELSAQLPGIFDVIVSNPPYVPRSEQAQMHSNVLNYEPHIALFVEDDDPLIFYRAIAQAAGSMLTAQGALYFEIHELFAEQMQQLLTAQGYTHISIAHDLNDKPRRICCRR